MGEKPMLPQKPMPGFVPALPAGKLATGTVPLARIVPVLSLSW